ncbi:MAG: hypothetical protein KC586_07355 [Myxococcales bacterium]|nr:hypothetical protein [Myxococcales bacterium]
MADDLELWDVARRARAGRLLADVLRAKGDADELARTLAPDGPGPGVRYHGYDRTLIAPKRREPYQARFATFEAFVTTLEEGDPGALELGCELLARLEPEAVLPVAQLLLEGIDGRPRWSALEASLGRALGACASFETWQLLLTHEDGASSSAGIASHDYAGGVDDAWTRVRGADLDDPRVRIRTLPFVSYLLRHDRERAFALTVELLEASHHVVVFATHALAGLGAEGRDVLVKRLLATPSGVVLDFARRFAVRVLLEDDTSATLDRLGGESALRTDEPRRDALVDWLAHDVWRTKTSGGPRGWLSADPRFATLLAFVVAEDRRRDHVATARDLLKTLPPARRPAAKKRARATTLVQPTPSPGLVREMETMRDRLARLVAHLARHDYRFVERRPLVPPRAKDLAALARLEKKVVVPASIACFWRTVGGVDLRGTAPTWPRSAYLFDDVPEPVWRTDPLVVAPAAEVVATTLDEHSEAPFALVLAPDAVGKAGHSGGTETLWLPQRTEADATFDGSDETFLARLRRALEWAGFPGLAELETREPLPEKWLAAAREASRG